MLVTRRIATKASRASRGGTSPAAASPAKITASDARSSRVSSRRPAADASPNSLAIPPSRPSRTCPKAISASPGTRWPVAIVAAAAALAPNAAHVIWAGVIPSPRCRSRSNGRMARLSARPSAGANSYMAARPPYQGVQDDERRDQDPFLHLVRYAREPAAGHPARVRVERHLLESHAVVHRRVDREEEHRHDRVQQQRERDDPQERYRLLQRGAPVVAAPVPQADVLQVVGRLDRVVHVHADAEGVRERRLTAVQLHRLDPEGRGEDVGDDRHFRRAGEPRGARPATRAPIRRRSIRRPAGGPRSRYRRRARGRVPGAGTADRASPPSSPPRTAPRTAR